MNINETIIIDNISKAEKEIILKLNKERKIKTSAISSLKPMAASVFNLLQMKHKTILPSVDPIHTHCTDTAANTFESSSERMALKTSAQTCKFNRIITKNENKRKFRSILLLLSVSSRRFLSSFEYYWITNGGEYDADLNKYHIHASTDCRKYLDWTSDFYPYTHLRRNHSPFIFSPFDSIMSIRIVAPKCETIVKLTRTKISRHMIAQCHSCQNHW